MEDAAPIDITIPGYDPATAPVIDLEERSRIMVKEAKARDARNYYLTHCPPEFASYDIGHPSLKPNRGVVDRVLAWRRHGADGGATKRGMLLTGPTGLGKTRTCWELLRLLADAGEDVRHYHSMDFFSELQETVKYGRDDARTWVSNIAWKGVVFIDDWGQEANRKSQESWAESWFFRFLDLRIERGLPLIITTNLTAKDIAERTLEIRADPLLRRLLEICEVVKFVNH